MTANFDDCLDANTADSSVGANRVVSDTHTKAGGEGVATQKKIKSQNHHFSGGTKAKSTAPDGLINHSGPQVPQPVTEEELALHEDLSESCSTQNSSQSRRQIKASNMRSQRVTANLTWETAGGEVYKAIVDSDIVWELVNLALCW